MKIIVLFLSMVLAACAYSPQQLTINPQLSTTAERYGRGQVVQVEVQDLRPSPVLGNLGGAYANSSTITLAPGLEQALVQAAHAHLAMQGFSNQPGQGEPAVFRIGLKQLDYKLEHLPISKKLWMQAQLDLQVSYQAENFSGSYKTVAEHRLVLTPNQAKNEAMISDLLSQTLQRLFADARLQAFLSNL